MKILRKEGIRALYQDKRLKKFVLKFAKLLKKHHDYLQLYIDYIDEKELPCLILAMPDDLEIQDSEKFLNSLGTLFEEAGNLKDVHQMFLLTLEKISVVEGRNK